MAEPRAFRAVLPASARAPLPAAAQVRKVVPAVDSVWYLARDCSASPCADSVYQWSQAGVAQFAIASSGADTLEVRDLILDPSGLPLLVAGQGVLALEGGQFAPTRGLTGVRALASTGGGLWIVWNDDSVSFTPAFPPSGGEKRIPFPGRIEAWAATRAGDLWLAAASPAIPGTSLLYSVSRGGDMRLEPMPEPSSAARIRTLFTDRMDSLWVSLADGSLVRKSGGTYDTYGAADGLPLTPLTALEDDPAGNYYLLFAGGAMYGIPSSSRSFAAPEFIRFLFPGILTPLAGIALDARNGVWLAAGRGGAFRVQGTEELNWLRGWSDSNPATAAGRSMVAADVAGAPAADAIGIAPSGRFTILNSSNGLAGDQVSSIASDHLGNLYFTTGYAYGLTAELPNVAGHGISRWDHRAFTTFTTASTGGGLPSNTVHASLYDAANDVIWFGTDNGLARFNPNTAVFTSIASLAGVNARDLRLDAVGNLWVATLGQGVYKLRAADGAQLAHYTASSTGGQLASDKVTSIALDGLNQLWAGTDGGGLNQFNLSSSTWTHVTDASVSGDGNRIFDLETDASNNLWIGLPFHGIVRRTSAGVDSNFADPSQAAGNGLGRNRVYTIYRDGANNLWFCFTFSGEIGHVAATFLPAAQVNAASPAFHSYNAATDGFPVDNVLSFGQESSTAMWFGSATGGAWRFGGPVDAPGWPQALTGYVYYSSPVLADLDGDGKLEIVVGDTAGFIYAFHADGSLLWKYNAQSAFAVGTAGSIPIESSPSVADVDGDGKPEVVIGLGGQALAGMPVGQGGVLILSNTGTLKRVLYTYDITGVEGVGKQDGYSEGVFATPVLANVDDDPEPEIMVGGFDGLLYAWNADGSSIYSRDNDGDGKFDEDGPGDWTPWTPLDSTDDFPGWRGVDDDHNGVVDEGNSSDDDEDGMIDEDPAEWPFLAGDSTVASAVVGDILHNGKPAIMFGSDWFGDGSTTRGGFLRVFDQKANPLPGFPRKIDQVIWSSPVLVDLDGDGFWEIIHGTGLDLSGTPSPLVGRQVYAWNKDGSSFLSGANGVFASTAGRSFASFAVGDIDNDGQPELVIATSSLRNASGQLIDASGNPTANAIGQLLYVFRRDGSLMPGFPVQPYSINPAANLVGSPVLADVNGDGYLEILIPVAGGIIAIDRNGRGVPGMGMFENLQDVAYQGEMKSTPAVGDIDGDGILELVYAMGVGNDSSGILHVMKLGPVNSTVQRSWPMGRRIPSRNAIFDVLVGDAQAIERSGTTTIIAQAFAGRSPIASVVANLSSLGGSSAQPLYDDGAHGDRSANDGYFAFQLPTPSAAGRFQIPITVTDGAGRSDSKTIFYLHAGAGKLLSVSKSAIDFGAVGQGLNGEMHFSVANVGDQTVTITGMSSSDPQFYVAIPGNTPDSSSLIYPNFPTGGFPRTLAPGATLIVRSRLHPDFSPAGARSATLTINSDDPASHTIALTGSARTVAGGIQIPTSHVSFVSTAVGSTFDVYFNITSNGAEPLVIKSITFDNPAFSLYKLSNPPYPRTFDPGVVAPYVIRFKPSVAGPAVANMTITTNDAAHPTLTVGLDGTGTGSGPVCTYALGALSAAPAVGAAGASVTVTAPAGCAWTASSSDTSWLTVTSGSPGSGNGTVNYAVTANSASTARVATLTIAGQTFTVAQPGVNPAGCLFYLDTVSGGFPDAGGTGQVHITLGQISCSWTTASDAPWLTITSTYAFSNSGTVVYAVAPNSTGATRTGHLSVAGQTVTITQVAGCSFTLDYPSTSIPWQGGSVTVNLTASNSACPWTSYSTQIWAQRYPLIGTGSASIQVSVNTTANTGGRTATIYLGGQPFNITQGAYVAATEDERFVDLMYFGFLGRLPTTAERSAQLSALSSGSITRVDLAVNLFNTDEFNNAGRFAAGLYVGILGRDAEYAGWVFQRAAYLSGQATQAQLAGNFLGSLEYQMKYGTPTDDQFVLLLYSNVLRRTPTPAEEAAQLALLSSGTTRTQMAMNFLNSAEFRANSGPRLTAFLQYACMLVRDAEQWERDYWSNLMSTTMTVPQVFYYFVYSDEMKILLH